MNRWLRPAVCAALLLVAAVGCKDNPVAEKPAVTHLIIGEVIVRPYIDFSGNIHAIYGKRNEVDAIWFGDSACTITKVPSFVEGNNYTYGFSYYQPSDSARFHSGDTAVIRIVKGSETATVRLKLLSVPEDTVKIASPPNGSSVEVVQDIGLVWSRVPLADWYSIYYIYDTSTLFGAEMVQVYDFATDTSFVIPGSAHPVDGEYRIFIGAVTGPVPGTDGNVQSETMTGSIYCWAIPGVRDFWQITVGNGPTGGPAVGRIPDAAPSLDLSRIR